MALGSDFGRFLVPNWSQVGTEIGTKRAINFERRKATKYCKTNDFFNILGVRAPILRALVPSWSRLGRFWLLFACLGPSCAALGAILGSSWGHLAALGAVLGYLGAVLSHLGLVLEASWHHLGPSWAILGQSLGHLGPSWGHPGPSWGHLGRGSPGPKNQ